MAGVKNKKNRSNKANRSLSRLPKGLPIKGSTAASYNPFEQGPQKKVKHVVHNRPISGGTGAPAGGLPPRRTTALAVALQQRQQLVQQQRSEAKKSNIFQDRRLTAATPQEETLQRLIKERHSRISKRVKKFQLDDDNDNDNTDYDNNEQQLVLTHKGKSLNELNPSDHVLLSDTEEDYGDLEQLDTELHFGGGNLNKAVQRNPYGPSNSQPQSLSTIYAHRKTELDDLILRRKIAKAEKLQTKEEQVDTFDKLDELYDDELAPLLQFRDKKGSRNRQVDNDEEEEDDMAEWNREMQVLQLKRKVAATDRTKTPEEIASEQAQRLHELETKRLARMNGDFDHDDLSDVSITGPSNKKGQNHPEALDDDLDGNTSDNGKEEYTMKFTADGLVKVDKLGNIVKDVAVDKDKTSIVPATIFAVGTRVRANYHANEQFEEYATWYGGIISAVHRTDDGEGVTYNIDYDDGDFEEDVEPRHVQLLDESTITKGDKETKPKTDEDQTLKLKRQKAKELARSSIPFVFEVPTTLGALHDMIATHAKTGEEASLIIARIHTTNSVKLDRRNAEKMQNFYDVLLRRFVAVGEAIYQSGDGGSELGRFKQLDSLTQVLYRMTQDNPESASAVWSRRLGFFQNAHAKRLRDAELEQEDDDQASAWPSTGVFLTLRALGHLFPVTDQRHPIVTPALLLLGQMVSHTPIYSMYDLVMGLLCTILLIEYNKEAKRVVPEALAFLAGTIRLFAAKERQREADNFALPSLGVAASELPFATLCAQVSTANLDEVPKLSLFRDDMEQKGKCATAVLASALHMVTVVANALPPSSRECLMALQKALGCLDPMNETYPLPHVVLDKVVAAMDAIEQHNASSRKPLQRRSGPGVVSIKTLAPRLESSMSSKKRSRDSNNNTVTTALRQELQREKKAAKRELQWDATLTEQARRSEQSQRDQVASNKRHKAYAWLEQQQGEMNNQVRQGGGLLKGGGMGAARAKARSGKIGFKKGGKL